MGGRKAPSMAKGNLFSWSLRLRAESLVLPQAHGVLRPATYFSGVPTSFIVVVVDRRSSQTDPRAPDSYL